MFAYRDDDIGLVLVVLKQGLTVVFVVLELAT